MSKLKEILKFQIDGFNRDMKNIGRSDLGAKYNILRYIVYFLITVETIMILAAIGIIGYVYFAVKSLTGSPPSLDFFGNLTSPYLVLYAFTSIFTIYLFIKVIKSRKEYKRETKLKFQSN